MAAGARAAKPTSESAMVADTLAGQSRVARHRAVNDCLKPAFDAGLHALAIEVRTPDERDPRGGGPASLA